MFVCDINEQDISGPPPSKMLKKSQCTPLFMNAYAMRGKQIDGFSIKKIGRVTSVNNDNFYYVVHDFLKLAYKTFESVYSFIPHIFHKASQASVLPFSFIGFGAWNYT